MGFRPEFHEGCRGPMSGRHQRSQRDRTGRSPVASIRRRIPPDLKGTRASWLNQVEGFFGILGKQSLGVAHFPSKAALREHIDAYIAHWNDDPTPFIWTKPAASIIRSRKRNA